MIKKLCFLFAFVMIAAASMAQAYEWKEAKSNGYTYKYVTNDPTHTRFYTLKNGLTVILSPTDKEPRIQAFVAVKAGSKTDPATNTGLAHYLEHMMFKGTDKYGSLDWSKEKPQLDKIDELYEMYNKTTDDAKRKAIYHQIDSVSGVASQYAIANEYDKMVGAMGSQGTNAFTSFEETVYTDDVPSSSLDKYLTVQAERFRHPVLRLFHTELEAVYEEKNRGLDNDNTQVFEALFSGLFQKHNYGLQTTIGTIEHLKNPSLVQIRKYYNTYYVPNNMGIVLSGDFNPDETIARIDQMFSYMQEKAVPKYIFEKETPLTQPIVKEIVGPDAESLTMGFRLPGTKDKDVLLADLVGSILTNGKAGLLDLNLVKKQKLLRASASAFALIDYGVLYLNAAPTKGQSLEEVKSLVLEQIENLKKGNFDDDLIPAIVNNMKKEKIQQDESYSSRAQALMDAFTSEINWRDQVAYVNNLSKITKAEVVAFANKYLGDNYVAVFKRKGERKDIKKIDKPQITPVQTNADKQSDFVKMVNNMPSTTIQPVFLDYSKDIQKGQLGKAQVLYVQNKDNSIYRLRYRYTIGSLNDLKLQLATQYLQFLGTDSKSSEQISKEFYKIASSFKVSAGEEYTTVTIEGLQENFTKAVALFEDLMAHPKADQGALDALKTRISKARADAKLNKQNIMAALTNYAQYGPDNKFNYTLKDADLANLTADELVGKLKDLNKYEQTVIYYGPLSLTELTKTLTPLHVVPSSFAVAAPAKVFNKVLQDKNKVYFADYNMVQAETRWVRNSAQFDPAKSTMVSVFNEYFGGNMGAIVFQTIRESKALAYSTYAYYLSPSKKDDRYGFLGYVGTQADKFTDAVGAMNELLNKIPELPENLAFAKDGVKKSIQTQRITQDNIIFDYLGAQRLGLDYDIRKDIYNNVDKITMDDVKKFHAAELAGKPYTYVIVASENKVPESESAKLGEFKKLSLEELFGY